MAAAAARMRNVAAENAGVVYAGSTDSIAQLAAMRVSTDRQPIKRAKTENAGIRLGMMMGVGLTVFAAAAVFFRTPLSQTLFRNLNHQSSSASTQNHTTVEHLSPREAGVPVISEAATPAIQTMSENPGLNLTGTAVAPRSEKVMVISGPDTDRHSRAFINDHPTVGVKTFGHGTMLTHGGHSSHFDVNNPPGALFVHLSGD